MNSLILPSIANYCLLLLVPSRLFCAFPSCFLQVAGSALYFHTGSIPLLPLVGYVLASILIIAWLNLSNDYFDASTGVDRSKPESVVNLLGGNKSLVGRAALACFVTGAGLLSCLLAQSGASLPAYLLSLSIACGYVYQGPPFRWSYRGLGEPLCFVAFGPSATPAFFLALLATATAAAGKERTVTAGLSAVTPLVWLLACAVGLSTTLILLTSHFHQIEGDRAAGKWSPLVSQERAVSEVVWGVELKWLRFSEM
jgi:2-carboxy-1,4-naphthoquinone phytyltransferase